ncbi:EAL domain-containing protein [Methylophaga sp. OBS4]|uniref:EAL domain-containing protein n=1 Tax=Methylophaga sp. OBS4 TaxID=2991935 RepID=UPI00224D2196|nr:EAL domain-containing protein [Methylophaga sp. OBS4]MCX4188131.1 EAL domain-containing protein [Methylophaga sp. OBS4]
MVARAEGILRLLIVDDSLTDADGIINTLRSAGHAVRAAREDTPAGVEQLLTNQTWDLLICRDSVANLPPQEIVRLLQRLGKDLPCIILVNDKASEEQFFDSNAQDIVVFGDNRRLQFAANRELNNLSIRRLGRRNERALRESEKRSRALLESSRDAVAYMHEGMHIYVNQAYLKLFGYEEAEDIDGLPILDLIAADDHNKFKTVFRQFSEQSESEPETVVASCVRADGTGFNAKIEFSHARVEGENCTQVVIRDDAAFTVDDTQLKLLRDHDLLTGLYTRARFMDELEKTVYQAAEGNGDAELLYMVLDDFQLIKEQVGLGTSDIIIKSVAELLRKNMQEGEILGRYGDQVFTVIIPSHDDNAVDVRAATYLKTIDDYVSHASGKTIDLHCSIGISRINESQASAEAVLENADKACSQAQRAGGNQVARFQQHPSQAAGEGQSPEQWQQRLQKGLNEDKFILYYQPIVSLHGEEQELYEVLLRLQLAENRLMLAEDFINQAVNLKMMAEIDKWVIRNALDALADHRQQFPRTRFFIKLSEQTLHVTEFVDWLCASLDAHNLNGNALVFEISETAALDNLDTAREVIAKLKKIGCEFGLEHFGSGVDFSNSLSALDVDYLKINGAFVENMAHDTENQAAVKAIIEMSKQAGKRCIAEFVSDANSLALLWRLGVDYAQGFYIHEPSDKLDYDFEDDDL